MVPIENGIQNWCDDLVEVNETQFSIPSVFHYFDMYKKHYSNLDVLFEDKDFSVLKNGIYFCEIFNGLRCTIQYKNNDFYIFDESSCSLVNYSYHSCFKGVIESLSDIISINNFKELCLVCIFCPTIERDYYSFEDLDYYSDGILYLYDCLYLDDKNLTKNTFSENYESFKYFNKNNIKSNHIKFLSGKTEIRNELKGSSSDYLVRYPDQYSSIVNKNFEVLFNNRRITVKIIDVEKNTDCFHYCFGVGPISSNDERFSLFEKIKKCGNFYFLEIGKIESSEQYSIGSNIDISFDAAIYEVENNKINTKVENAKIEKKSENPIFSIDLFISVLYNNEIKHEFLRKDFCEQEFEICKTLEERYVLAVCMEPMIDGQSDYAQEEEIRKACHNWMENYRALGFYHKEANNNRVKLLESYIAPVDFKIDGKDVKAGSWLMAFRIISDSIWEKIKSGKINGISIYGKSKKIRHYKKYPDGLYRFPD